MTAAETYALAPAAAGSQRTVAAFARARAEGRTAVIPFVTAGYPTPQISEDVALAIVRGGADMLEIGVPFSDPLADGAVIYEVHVGGFTSHPSSGVKHPGTFAGLIEKIPYLRELGVTHVELMPVMAFDEQDMPPRWRRAGLSVFIAPR